MCCTCVSDDMYTNTSDLIMDMLGNPKMRKIITESYHLSPEQKHVRKEIKHKRYKYAKLSAVQFLLYQSLGGRSTAKP